MDDKTFQAKVEEIRELAEKENVPIKNLLHGDFVSNKLKDKYSDLMKLCREDPKRDSLKSWKYLRENMKLDYKKGIKYYLFDVAVIEKDSQQAIQTYPELKENEDEGLIKMPTGANLVKDGFGYKEHYLIFDREIRQHFSFVSFLINKNKEKREDFELSFKIDYEKLGIKGTEREVFLESYWDGMPGFNVNWLHKNWRDKRKPSYSKYGSDSSDLKILDVTEFLIKKKTIPDVGDCWQIEIEEHIPLIFWRPFESSIVLDKKEIMYFTRYLHAYLSLDFQKCYHIDWAYKDYGTLENYKAREKIQDTKIRKVTQKTKIFRLDSSKGITFWSEVINAFFYMNQHLSEYFNNRLDKNVEEQRKDSINKKVEKLMSCKS